VKLRKQAQLKAVLATVIAGLLAGFFALVRSESHVKAAADPGPSATPVDYGRFFAPNQPTPGGTQPVPLPRQPHTRTRAS